VGPVYGGAGGGNSWVVHAHRRPRRASRCSPISVDAQRGHESWAGNVTIPHAAQRLPISRGSSEGNVKRPSATASRAIACTPSFQPPRCGGFSWLAGGPASGSRGENKAT